MESKKNSGIRGREGRVLDTSGELQIISPESKSGMQTGDIWWGYFPKGQARNLRLHPKVMGSHLNILGSESYDQICVSERSL